MKRFAQVLILVFASFSAVVAAAQITLGDVERSIGGRIDYGLGIVTGMGDHQTTPGPYQFDILLDENGYRVVANHDTDIQVEGATLSVSGSLFTSVSATDSTSTVLLQSETYLLVTFQAAEAERAQLEVSLPGSGEVFFFDLTANDYDFDFPGPGVFTLNTTLVPNHEYLFQVNLGASRQAGIRANEASATLSFLVGPEPVAAQTTSWGSVKSLFR